MGRSYSPEQMEEILRRAMQREAAGEISHDDLLDAAREVGIAPDAVEAAARELDGERKDREREALVRRELRRGALAAVGNYLVLNALAFAVDALTGPALWFQWVALGTTALLLRKLFVSFFPSERVLERAERKLRRRQERELKHRDHARWHKLRAERQKQTAEQFERAVEEGLQALLKVAGDKLEQYNRDATRPAPRVRVEPAPGDDDAAGADEEADGSRGARRDRHPR